MKPPFWIPVKAGMRDTMEWKANVMSLDNCFANPNSENWPNTCKTRISTQLIMFCRLLWEVDIWSVGVSKAVVWQQCFRLIDCIVFFTYFTRTVFYLFTEKQQVCTTIYIIFSLCSTSVEKKLESLFDTLKSDTWSMLQNIWDRKRSQIWFFHQCGIYYCLYFHFRI